MEEGKEEIIKDEKRGRGTTNTLGRKYNATRGIGGLEQKKLSRFTGNHTWLLRVEVSKQRRIGGQKKKRGRKKFFGGNPARSRSQWTDLPWVAVDSDPGRPPGLNKKNKKTKRLKGLMLTVPKSGQEVGRRH